MPWAARSELRAAMKGCSIPAPAPCASTKQNLGPWGCSSNPDTRVVSLTSIVTRLEMAADVIRLRQSEDHHGRRAAAAEESRDRAGHGRNVLLAADFIADDSAADGPA